MILFMIKDKNNDSFYNTKIMLNKNVTAADPGEQYKILEKEINKLIEDSAILKVKGNITESLEKAKDAYNKEKSLRR